MKPLAVRRVAKRDIADAARWYRKKSAVIARAFLADVDVMLDYISKYPATGARVASQNYDARRVSLERFPYQVIYAEFPAAVVVLAVAHDRREPGYWDE